MSPSPDLVIGQPADASARQNAAPKDPPPNVAKTLKHGQGMLLKPWQACAFATASTAATFGIRMALGQVQPEPMLVIFTVPIMLSAYVGGLRAGLLATGLSYVLASYYLLPPFHSFRIATIAQRWNIFLVMLAGVVISALNEAVHRARRRAAITTLKEQGRVAVAKMEVLQSAIFNSANFSCVATDARGVIQLFNVGAECMLGYSSAEVVNRITPADLSDPQEVIARAQTLSVELGINIAPGFEALVFKASRGIEDVYELTQARKNGSRFPAVVSVTSLRDAAGEIIGYLLIGTDITARKKAEAALVESLRRAEDQLNASFKEINDLKTAQDEHGIVAVTDPKGKITYVNDKFCALSQFPRGELLGQDHRIINSGNHSKEFIGSLWETISAGRVWKGEIKNKAKDGTYYWVDSTIVPYRGPDGSPVQYISIGTDITGGKRSEEALQRTNAELESARFTAEKASRAKSEFLSSMSHELRTPLNGIIGFTEFLMDEKPGPLRPKQKEYLGDVLNSGRHLLQLINDVLDLSKVEAGKMELHPETFAVLKAVEEVTAVIQGIAQKKHIAVGIEIGPGLDAVVLDQHKFKQMLYNLLSNAVKFTDDDGQVDIYARRLDSHWFEVGVRDTGIGIKAEDLGRLFNEFEQLDSGTARRFEGTGLGLALTKKIIEFQGGRVSVESEPDHGSVFTVVLPVMTERRKTE